MKRKQLFWQRMSLVITSTEKKYKAGMNQCAKLCLYNQQTPTQTQNRTHEKSD